MSLIAHLLAAAVAVLLAASVARADDHHPLDSLPLPSPGKSLSATPGQKSFRVPLGFARVEKFYRDQFAGDARVTVVVERGNAGRTLTVRSRRPSDAWLKAVAREGAVDTLVEVTPVVRLEADVIHGQPAQPLVHFVMPPSPEVARQADRIDHVGNLESAHK